MTRCDSLFYVPLLLAFLVAPLLTLRASRLVNLAEVLVDVARDLFVHGIILLLLRHAALAWHYNSAVVFLLPSSLRQYIANLCGTAVAQLESRLVVPVGCLLHHL